MLKEAKDLKIGDHIYNSTVYSKRMNKLKTIVFVELTNGVYRSLLPDQKIKVEVNN